MSQSAARPALLILGLLTKRAYLSFIKRVVRISTRHVPAISSAAHKADAVESALCGYMAWIALAGLVSDFLCGKP